MKVKSISMDGSTATVTEEDENVTLSEFCDFIRIDTDIDVGALMDDVSFTEPQAYAMRAAVGSRGGAKHKLSSGAFRTYAKHYLKDHDRQKSSNTQCSFTNDSF